MTSIEIRVLGPTGIEDHHAHLMRLNPTQRCQRLLDKDEHSIDRHCLRLMASQVILIGGYIDGVLRADVELIPDRTAREAEAIFTFEDDFSQPAVRQMLILRMLDEARRYHLGEITLHGFDDAATLARIVEGQGVRVESGTPVRLSVAAAAQRAA